MFMHLPKTVDTVLCTYLFMCVYSLMFIITLRLHLGVHLENVQSALITKNV